VDTPPQDPRLDLLNQFLATPTWPAGIALVRAHPELLGDGMVAALFREAANLRERGDPVTAAQVDKHRLVLLRVRDEGADRVETDLAGRVEPTDPKSVTTLGAAVVELGDALVPQTRPVIQRHPVLLTTDGDFGLAQAYDTLVRAGNLADAFVTAERRLLLRRIRRLGIDAVYASVHNGANTEEVFRRLLADAAAHSQRYEQTHDPADLDDALAVRLEISRRMGESAPTEPFVISEALRLAATFVVRYLDRREDADLLAALARLEHLLANLSPTAPPEAVPLTLAQLIRAYLHRYRATTADADLDRLDDLLARYADAVELRPDELDPMLRDYGHTVLGVRRGPALAASLTDEMVSSCHQTRDVGAVLARLR
jgi:hypothetical protein